VRLLDVVRDPASKVPSLIFEHVDNTDFKVVRLRAAGDRRVGEGRPEGAPDPVTVSA
jgi:hypothetical protein